MLEIWQPALGDMADVIQQHVEIVTKWPAFGRHLQMMHIKLMYVDWDSLKFVNKIIMIQPLPKPMPVRDSDT